MSRGTMQDAPPQGAKAPDSSASAPAAGSPPPPGVPSVDLYAAVRAQIEHEDNLMTQRLNWLMAAQSFLFMAYAMTLNAAPLITERAAGLQRLLRDLVPVMATAICVLVEVTIVAGVVALVRLRAYFRARGGDHPGECRPPIHGAFHTQLMGLSGPLALPVLFAAVWVYLLVRGRG